ncbi:MAG TPA: MFS transporter [Actinomycetota bacterium]|nr:MFS transporter [Actinomycetota bacterium]
MRTRPRLLSDFTPLRESRQYRLLYAGELVALLGSQLTVVAVPLQVYLLTRSSLAVGLIGLAQLGPLLACSLIGGAVVDAVDRRVLLVWVQLARGALSAGLAVNALRPHPAIWPLYVLTAAGAGLQALDAPARTAAVPALVRRELVPAAAALHQILMQVSMVAGPAVAGLVVARASLAAAYGIDVATFTLASLLAVALRPLPPGEGGTRAGVASVREGLRFLRGRRVLQGAFLVDLNAMVFGMPRALFPALGTGLFHGGPGTVGLLYAAPGAGALVGALTAGWVGGVRRQGRAVLVAVAAWGAAVTLFGVVAWLPLALGLLALAGAADVVSAVFRSTILQLTVPDGLRGRLAAINIAVVTGGPRLGDAEAGAVAALAGPQFSVVSGGLACLAGVALLAWRLPELGRTAIEPDAPLPDGQPAP